MREFFSRLVILGGVLLSMASSALADEAAKPIRLDFRIQDFNSRSEGVYRSTRVEVAGENGSALYAAMSEGDRKVNTTGVRTGGYDFEIGFRARVSELKGEYQLGISTPRTAAEGNSAIAYSFHFDSESPYKLSLRGYAGATSAVGLFAETYLGNPDKTSLHLRVGGVFSGQTTLDDVSGQGKRQLLIRASLNHRLSEMATLSVGVTNDLGDTTRFSMNSSVGNSFAATLGLQVRF